MTDELKEKNDRIWTLRKQGVKERGLAAALERTKPDKAKYYSSLADARFELAVKLEKEVAEARKSLEAIKR